MLLQNAFLLGLLTLVSAWLPQDNSYKLCSNDSLLPSSAKIRGVNLGSLFIVEPWMAFDAWKAMGCGDFHTEFDCMKALGQTRGNEAFKSHWNSWITRDDIKEIASLGLNTLRIPVGFWMYEPIVDRATEWFPEGGFPFLERVCNWAAELGIYVIIDLHAAPGSQVVNQQFAGQFISPPGFYNDTEYERAYKFLDWMTENIHTNNNFRSVGMLEVMNEPVHTWEFPEMAASMISDFYPHAWNCIRAVEDRLNINPHDRVHIQMMNEKWGTGNPNQNLTDTWYAAYDDHRYIKWSGTNTTREAYLNASCHDDRGGDTPTIVGEWSLSVADTAEWGEIFTLNRTDAAAWYKRWWAAQVMTYEKQVGWIFWSWKANWIGGLNEWRWAYQSAVAAGAIPRNPEDAYSMGACDGV
ncbi:glycoside hydrolase family 5 protein [Trichophaea hybrida]|nr:glycoside hydrolase family 5 protein [Trichophaea hybrida]